MNLIQSDIYNIKNRNNYEAIHMWIKLLLLYELPTAISLADSVVT